MSELHQSLEMEGSSPFAFLKRPSLGSPLGSYSITTDCGLRLHGARLRQAVQGARSLRRDSACNRRARASSHGLAYVGSAVAVLMFLTTLPFLFSTPGWEPLGGFPALSGAVGQFLSKDVVLLGAAIWSLGEALTE